MEKPGWVEYEKHEEKILKVVRERDKAHDGLIIYRSLFFGLLLCALFLILMKILGQF